MIKVSESQEGDNRLKLFDDRIFYFKGPYNHRKSYDVAGGQKRKVKTVLDLAKTVEFYYE